MNVKPIVKGIISFCKKHSCKLLAGGAIIAQGVGYYFMHKEAPIVHERLKALPEGAKPIDKFKAAASVYIPAFGMFLLSSGCIIGGVISGEHKIAILNGLYTASQAALAKFEEGMVAEVGEEKTKECKEKALQAFLEDSKTKEYSSIKPYNTGKGIDYFQDPFTGMWFLSSRAEVENGVAEFNRILTGDIWATVNDLRNCWGLEDCKLGEHVGWNTDTIYDQAGTRGLRISYEAAMTPWNIAGQRIKIHDDVVLYNGQRLTNFG